MEPLDPNDPLSKLLDQARSIEPRGNFTQNVLREARQTPQDRGWLASVRSWLTDTPAAVPAFRLAAMTAILTIVAVAWWKQESAVSSAPSVAEVIPEPPAPVQSMAAKSSPVEIVDSESLLEESPLVPEVETQWQNLDHLDALLAVEDTSMLSDSQIAFILY